MNSIGPNFQPSDPRSSVGSSQANNAAQKPTGNPSGENTGNLPFPLPQPPAGTRTLNALLTNQSPLAPGQLAQLLRNLLQMPREITQLLALLAEQEPDVGQELLQKLMDEQLEIPLEALQGFLQGRLDKAQDKLLKLMQSVPSAVNGAGQDLGGCLNGLSEMAAQTQKSPMSALQTTLLLYLPFYPLQVPQAFSLRFEPPDGEGEGQAAQTPQLVVYIETLTMGLFRASILTEKQAHWQAVIEYDAMATEALQAIQAGIQEAAPLEKPELVFQLRAGRPSKTFSEPDINDSKTPTQPAENATKQSVALHTASAVCLQAVHAAYLLIRVILELDTQNALHQGRAARLELG